MEPTAPTRGGERAGRLTSLEPVDVLCVEPQKQPLVMQQSQEVVNDVGPVVPGVQLLGQSEKGLGVVEEKRELENGLRVGDVVLLEVAVAAAPRRPAEKREALSPAAQSGRGSHGVAGAGRAPEVRDAAGRADAGAHHDQHPRAGSGPDQLGYILQGKLLPLTAASISKDTRDAGGTRYGPSSSCNTDGKSRVAGTDDNHVRAGG